MEEGFRDSKDLYFPSVINKVSADKNHPNSGVEDRVLAWRFATYNAIKI